MTLLCFFTGQKEIFKYCRLLTHYLLLWYENIEEKPLMFQQIIFVISDFDNIEILQDLESRYNNYFKTKEISTQIKFVTLSDNYVATVTNFISTLDTRIPKAVIIINSESLSATSQSIDYQNTETDGLNYKTDIDILYKNIANTVYELSEFIKNKNIYMILDSNLYYPHYSQLSNALSQLENLIISGISQEALREEKELAKIIQRIMTLISHDQPEEMVNSILAIEDDLIKIQLFYKAEHIYKKGYFYIYIRELLEKLEFKNKTPRIYLKLAEIASYCDYSQMCIDFLNKAIFINEDDLEIAYDLARKHDAATVFDQIVNKLRQSYPRSNKLLIHDVNIYIKNEDYERAIQLLTKQDHNKTFAEKISFLTQMIDLKNGSIDYWKIIKELPNNYYGPSFEILFNYAIDKKFYDDASQIIDLYEAKEENLKNATHLRIKLLIDYFFCDKENKDDIELIQYIIRNIIKYISNNIDDCYTRDYFFAFLDDKTHHAYKLSILINLVVTEFQQIKQISNTQDHKDYIDDRLAEETIPKVLNYLKELPIHIVGITKIPRGLLPDNVGKCKQLSNNLLGCLSPRFTAQLHEQMNENSWYLLIILLNSIATYYPDLVDDIKFFELLCSNIYITDPQRCRDHIDQICYMSGDNQIRQQNAWFAVGDLYHKMNYQQYALTALMCGLYNHPNMSYDFFYKSSNILVKLLRDIKLLNEAQNVLSFNRKIISENNNNLYLVNKHYLDFLELTIKLRKLLTSEFDQTILVDLMNEACSFAINELEKQREIKQIAILLVQIVLYAQSHDLHIPDNVEKILQKFDNIDKGESEYLYKTFRKANIDDLFKFYQNITDARNNRDSAYDYELLSISLKTILNDANKLNNHEDLVFAMELLTDPTLVMLNSKTIYKPLDKYTNKIDAKKTLIDISIQYKIPILMLTINNNKELISLLCNENGKILSKIEDTVIFSFQSFLEWKSKYPYSYKDYNFREDSNLFFNSVNHIGISQEVSGKIIVILDVDLQSLTPNLLLHNNDFLGNFSAITTSPSLSWLKYKLSNPTVTSSKFVSWISTAETPEAYTLKTLAENFNENIFPKYDIHLDTDQNPPKTLTGSELLIVAAHGGVTETNNIFYSISDEGEQEQKSSDLISRFEGCGVIILFICSAGRVDQHPESRTTISFVQELLNHGCETIIAPAWPIDPMMTLKWLPIFLDSWVDQKQTINDAVFQANKFIANSYSYDPSKCLALNVYGNPLKQCKAKT